MSSRRLSCALLFALPLLASAQLTRQAATTLNALPADLPTTSSYTTANALGALTFSAPMCTAYPAGETNRLFVAERAGTIQTVHSLSTTPTKQGFFALTSLLAAGETLRTDGENGFLSVVFHPNYATNGTFFVYFSMEAGGQLHQRLHQVTVADPAANTATLHSHKPLLTIRDRETNHNGGDLHFGADGFLYLSLGDEGASGDSRNNARFINHRNVTTPVTVQRTGFWGQLLRIAVEKNTKTEPGIFPENTTNPNPHVQTSTAFPSAVHAGSYRVPLDNPFHGYTLWHSRAIDPLTVRTEIYATGLRNPFRWSFDPPTGRLFLGDVGQNAWEEIHLVNKGDDLGWSWREGFHAYTTSPRYPDNSTGTTNAEPPPPQPGDPPGTGFSPRAPIFEYDHANDGVGNDAIVYGVSLTGGMVYRGNRLTELYGDYIFADYSSGHIVALRELPNGTWQGRRLGTNNSIVDFGTDPRNGDLIFCDLSGAVRRLVRGTTAGTNPPALLSQTGAFSSLANLTPQPGVVPYTPNVGFWSDYAIKSRWFAIRNTTDTIGFDADGNWSFPAGMVWVKHFDFDLERGNPATRRKLETRFLVKTATDVYGLSYRWRTDQTDADLVVEDGLTEAVAGASPAQTWRFPSRAECKTCHTPVGGFALSFNTRQLNRAAAFGAQTLNQIAALRDATGSGGAPASYFTAGTAPATTNHLPSFAAANDVTASLDHRVRSYLAVNCVQCHQPGGAAQGNWTALPTVPTDAANLINGLLVNELGDEKNRFAVPGDVTHSMVLRRIQGLTAPRMPPLATSQRNLAAEQLLTDWIMTLTTRQNFTQWRTAHFGSTSAPDAQPASDPDGDGERNSLEFLRGTSPLIPTAPLPTAGGFENGQFALQFTHPANRSCLVETSTDLQAWTLWDVAGNAPLFPSADTLRTLIGPAATPSQFFRIRLGEQ